MSLTNAFRRAQRLHPDWSFKQLAADLKCDPQTLRGINQRLKLSVPVKFKSPNGIRQPKKPKTPTSKPRPIAIRLPRQKAIEFSALQTGSGRKQYGSYLRLL